MNHHGTGGCTSNLHSQKGVPRLGTYTHTMLPPVWWYAQSAVELSWSDESRSSTRMCVLLVEGYLLQRTRDKRRAINMSPTWSRSRVVMSPGETPRDRYHPISQFLNASESETTASPFPVFKKVAVSYSEYLRGLLCRHQFTPANLTWNHMHSLAYMHTHRYV